MSDKKELTIKDMVTIGVFSAIYCVFYMIGGVPFGINPALTFYQTMGSALLCGPVYMLLLGCVVMGFVADAVSSIGKYKSKKFDILSYMVFSVGGVGSFLVYFMNPNGWTQTMIEKGTDQSYLATLNSVAQPWMLYVIIIGTALSAAISGWIGSILLKKQFEKAGIVD